MTIKEQLIEKLSHAGAMPFLFVGSGISLRYLGADTFIGLLARFCKKLPRPFEYYYSLAGKDCPHAASLMSEPFHDLWFKSDDFLHSRERYMGTVGQKDAPLKIEIAKYMLEEVSFREPLTSMRDELALFEHVEVDGIITTNWDLFLDQLFPQYQKFVGQDQLLFSTPQSIAEIYKIHGCCTDHTSMVLTREDYKAFERKNAYLAAKLLTVFVEHPIVFLGYSIDDENIKKILQSIAKCLSPARLRELSGRLFFVQWVKGLTEGTLELDTISKSLPLTIIKTDSFSPVYEALAATKRTIPAKTLRKLKEQVYHLVKTNDPKVKQFVSSLEALESGKGPSSYLGVGPLDIGQKGYTSFTLDDLVRDVIFDKNDAEPEAILTYTLPRILKVSQHAPVFKYLARSKRISDGGQVNTSGLPDIVVQRIGLRKADDYRKSASQTKKDKVRSIVGGVRGVWEAFHDHDTWASLIPLLPIDQIDVDDLRALLQEECDRLLEPQASMRSPFRRLTAFFDWLLFDPLSRSGNR